VWERVPAKRSGEGLGSRLRNFFSLGVFWCILRGMFVRVLARKVLNFPPEVVIWWTFKMYF